MTQPFYMVLYTHDDGYLCYEVFSTKKKADEFKEYYSENSDGEMEFWREVVYEVELLVTQDTEPGALPRIVWPNVDSGHEQIAKDKAAVEAYRLEQEERQERHRKLRETAAKKLSLEEWAAIQGRDFP